MTLIEPPVYQPVSGEAVYGPTSLHRNLGRTCKTAVHIAQERFRRWTGRGKPEVELESQLLGSSEASAERIDVNLEGISARDLNEATAGAGGSASTRTELRLRYMTSWEMNQIYFGRYLSHTFWHTGSSMTAAEASAVLGDRVPRERIIER